MANQAGIVGVVLLLFGFQALYSVFSGTSVDKWALFGMVLSIAGMAFFLPVVGIFAFAAPAAGRLYLSGEEAAVDVITESASISNLSALTFGGLAFFLYALVRSPSGLLFGGVENCPSGHRYPTLFRRPSSLLAPAYSSIVLGFWKPVNAETRLWK